LGLQIGLREIHAHADAPYSSGLLRGCRERPCGRSAAELALQN
jgi:hypothetical protein